MEKQNQAKERFYRRWWLWVIAVIVIAAAASLTEKYTALQNNVKVTGSQNTEKEQKLIEILNKKLKEEDLSEEEKAKVKAQELVEKVGP